MSPASLISLLAHVEQDDGWIGHWSPGIGDPTFVGWFTVVAYLVAAYLCRRVYRRLPGPKPADVPAFVLALAPLAVALAGRKRLVLLLPARARLASMWLGFALVLLFLGINKQLDLQTAITEVGRIIVTDEGWGSIHRILQAFFILGVLLVGLWILRSVLLLAQGSLRRLWPAVGGTMFILVFVAVRAISFHHIDLLLGTNFAGFEVNWMVELGGIGLIIYGAARELRYLASRPKRVMAVRVEPAGPPRKMTPKPAAAESPTSDDRGPSGSPPGARR